MTQVSRLYYALDAISYQAGTRVVDPRFHGFEDNAVHKRPGGASAKFPEYMLDKKWLEKEDNRRSVIIDDEIKLPFDLVGLVNDNELDGVDLAALRSWAEAVDPVGTATL